MKKFTMSLFALFLSAGLLAQYYYIPYEDAGQNPGGLNTDKEFPQGGGLADGWNVALAGAVSSPQWSNVQSIPFSFDFNGQSYSQFIVSSTGVLTFETTATNVPGYVNEALPSTEIPDNSLCLWGLKPATASNLQQYPDILTKTFGTAPNRQFWIQFNTYCDENIKDGWAFWSIMLEESTNHIYFVDQRTYCLSGSSKCSDDIKITIGVQINSTEAYQVSGSPDVGSFNEGSAETDDNAYYQFLPGDQPVYDLGVTKLTLDNFLILNEAPFTITGEIRNFGKMPITSFDLNYKVNGGGTVTAPLVINPLAIFKTKKFEHLIDWTPTSTGSYTIEVWASNINGTNPDEYTDNDKGSQTVSVVDKTEQRLVLHEVFTSSTCGPCNPGNANLKAILENNTKDEYTVIKYQQNFPGTGDPYATAESVNRRGYYGVNSIPRMEVDGGWDGNANNYTQALYDGFTAIPSFIDLSATFDVHWHTINVDVTIDPLADFNSSNLRCYIAVIENLTTKNIKSNGEVEFEQVMKKMLPDENGKTISSLTKGQKVTVKESYTFPGVYRLPFNGQTGNQINTNTEHSVEDFKDLAVVVWIQDEKTMEVFQSAWGVGTFSGTEENGNNGIVSMYPNPVNDMSYLRFRNDENENVSISVYDMMGKVVYNNSLGNTIDGYHTQQMDFSGFQSGMYILNLTIGENTYTRKFIKE